MSQGDLGLCQRLYVRYKSGVKNCNTKDEDKLRYELRLKLGSVRFRMKRYGVDKSPLGAFKATRQITQVPQAQGSSRAFVDATE